MLEGANPFNMCVTHEFIVFLNRDNFAARSKLPYLLVCQSIRSSDRPLQLSQLTNGGGVSEQERCTKLSKKLGFEVLIFSISYTRS
jgi:hypothetical protein